MKEFKEMMNVEEKMVNIRENLETDIDCLCDYSGSNYISDALCEIAGNNADGYSVVEVVKEHESEMEEIISEYGWTGRLSDAAFYTMERIIRDEMEEELAEGLELYALNYIKYTLNMDTFPACLWLEIEQEIEYGVKKWNFDWLFEIEDLVDEQVEYMEEDDDENEEEVTVAAA